MLFPAALNQLLDGKDTLLKNCYITQVHFIDCFTIVATNDYLLYNNFDTSN